MCDSPDDDNSTHSRVCFSSSITSVILPAAPLKDSLRTVKQKKTQKTTLPHAVVLITQQGRS